MEVPVGFEPAVKDLQSCALPTWLRNHRERHLVYHVEGESGRLEEISFESPEGRLLEFDIDAIGRKGELIARRLRDGRGEPVVGFLSRFSVELDLRHETRGGIALEAERFGGLDLDHEPSLALAWKNGDAFPQVPVDLVLEAVPDLEIGQNLDEWHFHPPRQIKLPSGSH